DSFNLPLELQGGIGNISSRRPSYAAESFTRSNFPPLINNPLLNVDQSPQVGPTKGSSFFGANQSPSKPVSAPHNPSKNLSSYAMLNNYNQNFNFDQLNDNFANFNLNSNFNDFQARRPSQLVDFQQPQFSPHLQQLFQSLGQANQYNQAIKLENGLVLKDQYIIASPDLKSLYSKTTKYFQDPEITSQILSQLYQLLADPSVIKMITFIKNLNNLTFNHKILCLVINKNGKFDLLSYPNNSNIFLQKDDLVIVDGDRGKDSVMIVEPLVNLNFAILFNFLKKLEHLKSLTIEDGNQHGHGHGQKSNGTHSASLNASQIINSHPGEDNEFIITLPTKQVLRFATPKEVHKISGKFLEEKKAFITCFNKIKELNLEKDLTLINVEYQSDFKKLIFYYFANFKRIDFRGLIKELFKIYKTRIWLCAVLPYDRPELYIKKNESSKPKGQGKGKTEESTAKSQPQAQSQGNESANRIPREYDLSNDQILNFLINEFDHLSEPNYFHLVNLLNLLKSLSSEVDGHFYGFNTGGNRSSVVGSSAPSNSVGADRSKILPSFNPFGDS
ncbi:PSP1-domain-containing protein, partial [Suhomyces tanzawaensis NRRL Y-17324]